MARPDFEPIQWINKIRLAFPLLYIGKVFYAVLKERLCTWTESVKVLGEEQNSFYMDKRAEDNVFITN